LLLLFRSRESLFEDVGVETACCGVLRERTEKIQTRRAVPPPLAFRLPRSAPGGSPAHARLLHLRALRPLFWTPCPASNATIFATLCRTAT